MPWSKNSELPDNVTKVLPAGAQTIFRSAANKVFADDGDDSAASAAGWAAVKNAGYSKSGETWIKKHYVEDGLGHYVEHQHVDQRAANYKPATAMNKSCGVCEHYNPDGACDIVAGYIRPDYVSDAFEPKANLLSIKNRDGEVPIMKADEERQLVFGWASVAINKAGEIVRDHHGDQIEQDMLEEAGYAFVLESREGNDMHAGDTVMKLVESMAFTDQKIEALAKSYAGDDDQAYTEALAALQKYIPRGLWHGYYVEDPAIFEKVKDGERRMFSIEGVAIRDVIEEPAVEVAV